MTQAAPLGQAVRLGAAVQPPKAASQALVAVVFQAPQNRVGRLAWAVPRAQVVSRAVVVTAPRVASQSQVVRRAPAALALPAVAAAQVVPLAQVTRRLLAVLRGQMLP